MSAIKNLLLALACLSGPWLFAQQTTVYTEANAAFKQGTEFFDLGLYGKAQTEFNKAVQLLRPVNEGESQLLLMKAELGYAKSAVRQELPYGEKLMLDFIRKYQPDPIANQALIEVANYYYNAQKYEKAIEYFGLIPTWQLTEEQRSEVQFKTGYAYFIRKKFSLAKASFQPIKDVENRFYYPTNYYYGLCEFFEGRYPQAVRSFEIVERSRQYKPHVPYYIAQIHLAQGEYQQLIDYAVPKANDSGVQKQKELNQLIGQAYFELEDYENALPYLEYYAERSGTLREEEFYQLAFTQYRAGKYASAVSNFEQLGDVESELGQYAMFYIADAHLKLGNKTEARNAFGKARRMNYDPQIAEESSYNFAKLSYELGYDRDAVAALQSIPAESRYYRDAQTLMSEIFLNTRDYERAIGIIENTPGRTPQLREAYQKVTFYRGIQLYREGQYDQANTNFLKSGTEPVDQSIKAAAIYWQGDIAHRKKKYNESIRLLNQFLTLAKTMPDLPEESSLYTANYTQGYNYLKQENFSSALGYFQDAIATISRNKPFIRSNFIREDVLGDATLRAGDCYFKRNRYDDAVRFYNEAISNRYNGFVYALYQKGIIEGLRGRTTEKVLALENIIDNYANTEYADDALLALAITYQEIGQLSKAVQPLKTLVADYRNNSDLIVQGLLRLGLISYNQGDLQVAMEYYKQVFSNNPDPAEAKDALTALEEIYVDNLGDPDGYARFLETIPGYKLDNFAKDSLNFKAAESQYENGNFERAVTNYSEYIRKFPNGQYRLQAHQHRGESYFELKQYNESLGDFDWVVEQGPSRYYAKALQLAALISYNYTQNFQQAFGYYSKLEKAAPTENERFEAQLGAMQSAYRINNTQAVYEMAGKVSNNPSATVQQKATANFYLGKMAFDNRDYDAALSAFNKVVQINTGEEAAEARYLIANIAYLRRDLSAAENLANRAIQENSAFPYWVAKSMILLSDTYADMGDLFNARAVLEAIVENYDGDQTLLNEAKMKLNKLNQQAAEGSRLDRRTPPDNFELDDGSN